MLKFPTNEETKQQKVQSLIVVFIVVFWSIIVKVVSECYDWLREHEISSCLVVWIIFLAYLFYYLSLKKRSKKIIKDVIYYDAPKDFTAAEVAVINTWWPTWNVFPAMLYDWVAKKNVKIGKTEKWELYFEKITDKPVFLSDVKYLYAGHKAYNRDPEDDFWKLCFKNRTRVTVRMLSKIPWIDKLANDFFYQVQRQCLDWEAYKKNGQSLLTFTMEFSFWIFFISACLFLSIYFVWFPPFILALFPFMLALLWALRLFIIYENKKRTGRDYYLTDRGVKILEHIQWLKKYLSAVEDSKLKVILREDPTYFERILPYAIAMWIWDWWIHKCFNHIQYDDFWGLIWNNEFYRTRVTADEINSFVWLLISSISYWNSLLLKKKNI